MYEKIKEIVEKEIVELEKYQLEQRHMSNNPAVYGEVSPNGYENAKDSISEFKKILHFLSHREKDIKYLMGRHSSLHNLNNLKVKGKVN